MQSTDGFLFKYRDQDPFLIVARTTSQGEKRGTESLHAVYLFFHDRWNSGVGAHLGNSPLHLPHRFLLQLHECSDPYCCLGHHEQPVPS